MKRRLIIGGSSAVIVLCLAGIVLVALGLTRWSWPAVHPPPWPAGRPLTAVPVGDDPELISYATAELIRHRMAISLDLDEATFESTYSFDEDATLFEQEKPAPPGLVAAVSAYQGTFNDGPGDSVSGDLFLGEYLDTAARDTALRSMTEGSGHPFQVVAAPRIDDAVTAKVIRREGACASGRGRNTSMHGIAAVAERTIVSVGLHCTTPEEATALVRPTIDRLTAAVRAAAGLEDQPIPATLFDRTDRVPVISDGAWSDRQVVVDPSAGERGLRAVPEQVRAPGLEVYLEGRDAVAAFRDPAAATALLERILSTPDRHDREVVERTGTAADRTVCAEGYRPRERSQCFSQVGRFVVVARADQGRDPEVDDQLTLLREAR